MTQLPFVFNSSLFAGALGPGISKNSLLDYVIFSGALLLLAGLLVIWAVAFRKPRRKRRRKSSSRRNPTLAETRGLPPFRDKHALPPEDPQS